MNSKEVSIFWPEQWAHYKNIRGTVIRLLSKCSKNAWIRYIQKIERSKTACLPCTSHSMFSLTKFLNFCPFLLRCKTNHKIGISIGNSMKDWQKDLCWDCFSSRCSFVALNSKFKNRLNRKDQWVMLALGVELRIDSTHPCIYQPELKGIIMLKGSLALGM